MEKVTALSSPPIVGRSYLVPTCDYQWMERRKAWPVFPILHEDTQFFNFPHQHYHVDPRFLSKADQAWLEDGGWIEQSALAIAQSKPLNYHPLGVRNGPPEEHPPLVWRRRVCQRSDIPYEFADALSVKNLNAHFAGRQCERARTGWVCPHWNIPLGSFPPVDGVITCPMHGLRIDAATGLALQGDAP